MKVKEVVAVVQSVVAAGNHGRYAVTISDDVEGSITFSLRKDVWQEKKDPEPGIYVVLSVLRKKRSGWRAYKARFFRLKNGLRKEKKTTDEKTL